VWFADTSFPDDSRDTGLMRDLEVLVRERVTPVGIPDGGTEFIRSFSTSTGAFNVSDNGRFVIFAASLTPTVPARPNTSGPVNGAFLVTLCPADTDGNGEVTVQDLFDFLALYLAGNTRADFDATGDLTIQDVFEYLAEYVRGCSEG
jgi:hypothetical protein